MPSEILVSFEDKKDAIATWIEKLSGVPKDNIRAADETGKYDYPGVILAVISEVSIHRPLRVLEEKDDELLYVIYDTRRINIDFNFVTRDRGAYQVDQQDRVLDAKYYLDQFLSRLYLPFESIEFLSQNSLALLAQGPDFRTDEKKRDGWLRRQTVEISLSYVKQTTEPVTTIESIRNATGTIYYQNEEAVVEINLGPYQPTSEKGQPNGYASLDETGKIPVSELPDIPSAGKVFLVGSELAQLALIVNEGDICKRTDETKTYAALNSTNEDMGDWMEIEASPQADNIIQDAFNRLVSDAQISTWDAKQDALGFTPEDSADKGAADGYASLGADSKVPGAQLPDLVITTTHVANSEVAQLALTVQEGDVCVRTDENKTYIALNETNEVIAEDWQELLSPSSAVTSVDGLIGAVDLTGKYVAFAGAQDISGQKKFLSALLANLGIVLPQGQSVKWTSGGAPTDPLVGTVSIDALGVIQFRPGVGADLSFQMKSNVAISAKPLELTEGSYSPYKPLSIVGGVVNWNMATHQNVELTLTEDVTSFNATGFRNGQNYSLRRLMGGAGSYTITWGTEFKWSPNGIPPSGTLAIGSLDIYDFDSDGSRIDGALTRPDSR